MTNDGSGGKCVMALALAAAVTYGARIMEIERRKTDGTPLIIGNDDRDIFSFLASKDFLSGFRSGLRKDQRLAPQYRHWFDSFLSSSSAPPSKQFGVAAPCLHSCRK